MREIGGYLELEKNYGSLYHDDAIALNNARNCLVFLIEARNIKSIFLPKFLCSSVSGICKAMDVRISYYPVDGFMKPQLDGIAEIEWIYYVNYYGQTSNEEISILKSKYPNLIIDNVQAYFQMPVEGVDTIYSCRKFVGVPDGGFLYTDADLDRVLEQDCSYDRMEHVLGRFETLGSDFYQVYRSNEEKLRSHPLRTMSKVTKNLLKGLDYETMKLKRERNFLLLDAKLGEINQLKLCAPVGPYMYPFLVTNGADLRRMLQEKKIYVATLWPDVFDLCAPDEVEYQLASYILPLPVDQRYGREDMEYIMEVILECVG